MKNKNPELTMAVWGAMMALTMLTSAHATTLYKWVDEDGNVTYQDTPPPENVEFEASDVDTPRQPLPADAGARIEAAALDNPVSLYSVPVCNSCDLVRLFLERNSIPFIEKNVQDNIDLQGELEAVAGALTVPTLTIGDKVLDGFSRAAIGSALEEAGFPLTADNGRAGSAGSGDSGDSADSADNTFDEAPLESRQDDNLDDGFDEDDEDQTVTDT